MFKEQGPTLKFWRSKGFTPKLFIVLMLIVNIYSNLVSAETVTLAVGPDHQRMLDRKYSVYQANWELMNKSLNDLGHSVEAHSFPWARAKAKVQAGELDGLFIAAKFTDRGKWAAFSSLIGYEIYGAFERKDNEKSPNISATVRLGGLDRVLSHISPEQLLSVPTAQNGLRLLYENKVKQFIMAQGYGQYLIDVELAHMADVIIFNPDNSERRSLHIAVSKHHKSSLDKLRLINKAIHHGITKGYYQQAVEKYNVPSTMQIKFK